MVLQHMHIYKNIADKFWQEKQQPFRDLDEANKGTATSKLTYGDTT